MICVSQAGAACPLTCALGIFIGAFHPAFCPNSASASNRDAWCWVGAPGGLVRMVFIMENGLWRPENAHFFPLRGRVTESAGYYPLPTPKKSSYTCRQIHWNLVPTRKKVSSRRPILYALTRNATLQGWHGRYGRFGPLPPTVRNLG